jgi:flagellar basal body rod protein FlgB
MNAIDAVSQTVMHSMDRTMLRHQVAARNIANANNPSFLAVRIAADGSTAATQAPVRLDHEVAEMVAAALNYQILADAISRHLSMSRMAISTRS